MVQTDLSQLTAECQEWRQILRNYREELQLAKKSLEEYCRNELTKDQLRDVEHFDNQFHIQLINIHDLKQSIKTHERHLDAAGEQVSDDLYTLHEELLNEFLSLESMLQELRNDYRNFVSATSC